MLKKEKQYLLNYVNKMVKHWQGKSNEYVVYESKLTDSGIEIEFGDDFYHYNIELSLKSVKKIKEDGDRTKAEYLEYNKEMRDNLESSPTK